MTIAAGVVLFVAGLAIGFFVGRDGRETRSPVAAPTPSGSPSPTMVVPPVLTPEPGQPPAISSAGQVLREGDRPVVAAADGALCGALVTPGRLGECGEVPLAGRRVVWVVERETTAAGTTAYTVRVFSFVPDAGGWVEWLQAADPTGERWSDVNVLPADLTGDGVAELIVGFRAADERATLEVDLVGYGQDNLPVVLAHPDPAARGVVVVAGGGIEEFGARYPNDEPACCPPSYVRQAISYSAGFFRVVSVETVLPNAVPASQV
ncbi:MAG TPA: hypothetical protein VE669_01065 [Actinomycetota bacterium]|nr:hypothetical protein [Actinomycetota bacterium]